MKSGKGIFCLLSRHHRRSAGKRIHFGYARGRACHLRDSDWARARNPGRKQCWCTQAVKACKTCKTGVNPREAKSPVQSACQDAGRTRTASFFNENVGSVSLAAAVIDVLYQLGCVELRNIVPFIAVSGFLQTDTSHRRDQ